MTPFFRTVVCISKVTKGFKAGTHYPCSITRPCRMRPLNTGLKKLHPFSRAVLYTLVTNTARVHGCHFLTLVFTGCSRALDTAMNTAREQRPQTRVAYTKVYCHKGFPELSYQKRLVINKQTARSFDGDFRQTDESHRWSEQNKEHHTQ